MDVDNLIVELLGFKPDDSNDAMFGAYSFDKTSLTVPQPLALKLLQGIPAEPSILRHYTNAQLYDEIKKISNSSMVHVFIRSPAIHDFLAECAIASTLSFQPLQAKSVASYPLVKILTAFRDQPAIYISTVDFFEQLYLPMTASRLAPASVYRPMGVTHTFTTIGATTVKSSNFVRMSLPGKAIARLPIPIVIVGKDDTSSAFWKNMAASPVLQTFFIHFDWVDAFATLANKALFDL